MHVALGVTQLRFSVPLGLAYVAGALRQAGHRVSLFVFGRHPQRAIRDLAADPPDLVAYGLMSGEHQHYRALHRELLRTLRVPSVWGGPHPTFFPEIIHEEGVDAVCIGEGEEAIVEFVQRYAETGKLPSDVRNFWVKDASGEVAGNPVRPLVHDLDSLPFPDRDLFFRAHPILKHHGIKHFIAHRGCPYKCTYCFNQAYHKIYAEKKPSYRSRDPELVCEEINQVRRQTRLEMVAFVDDAFTLSEEWLARFAQVYPRRVGLPYSCNFRLDHFNREIADLLAASGCRLGYVGIESGDDTVRRRLLARKISNEKIRASIALIHERGIRTITENMIGLPGETFEQASSTLLINMDVKPTLGNCSIFTPYPGLPLTRYAIRHGYFDGNYDDLGTNYYHESLMKFASARERNRVINMRCFFSLLSRHPGLWSLVKPLLPMRPNALVRAFGDLMDGYYLKKCLSYRLPPGRFFRILYHYMRAYR
jgi:radical SAM superfamily enzyme YgiQ (UPF0313 family)